MSAFKFAAGALCLALMAGPAPAVTFDFYERNGNVEGEFSGSLNLTGATVSCITCGLFLASINPSDARVINGSSGQSGGNTTGYVVDGPASFGTGGQTLTNAANRTGDVFGIRGGAFGPDVLVPFGYVSGAPLSGTIKFLGATFDSLGITVGSYTYLLPNDTVTINFIKRGGEAAIPLPATLPLLLGGLGLAFAAARRRA